MRRAIRNARRTLMETPKWTAPGYEQSADRARREPKASPLARAGMLLLIFLVSAFIMCALVYWLAQVFAGGFA